MTAQEMWKLYGGGDVPYEAWSFGDAPDRLAELVLSGRKTGTSSAYALYEYSGDPIPNVGEYSVVLNSKEEAVCVIRNVRVSILPYREIGDIHAILEGEGDRSLKYWRQVHQEFFRECMGEYGLEFCEDMLVVFEEFERVYP